MITKLDSFYARIAGRGVPTQRTWGYRLRLGDFIVDEGALDVPLPVVMFLERQGTSMLGAEVVECLIDQIDSRFTFDEFELVVYSAFEPRVVMACAAMRFAA